MKKILYVLAFAGLLCLNSCSHAPKLRAKPDNIIPGPTRPELFQKIMAEFPESQSIRVKQKALFESSAQKRVILLKESEVFVTFIAEGASYENTFGWYAYDSAAVPTQSSKLELHVLFPTVSENILTQGDMLQVGTGKFPAGTVIGFFLIIRGWQDGAIHYDRETFYTDFALNQNGQQQHVLFKQQDLGDLVLSFEDLSVANASDQDYNDIIFTVTDNKANLDVTNFDLRKVVRE
jgi:hypothetical protein